MNLIVTQGGETVAVVSGWEGPVPRKGDYVYHPQHRREGGQPVVGDGVARCVIQVVWGLYGRPEHGGQYFVNAADPFVEVVI